ncbi:hypothetical protein YYE_03028 [Plasmodium vinckei vinckei]|nr:hypothetical protein YYE_03028 [Plasmodium vinckei vinckei]
MDSEYHEPTNKEKETKLLNNSNYNKSYDNKTTQIKNLRNDENQSSQNIKESEWKKDKDEYVEKIWLYIHIQMNLLRNINFNVLVFQRKEIQYTVLKIIA